MLLKEILPLGWGYEIVASDISFKCLMVGKEAFYADSRIQGFRIATYPSISTSKPGGNQVKEEIKKSHSLRLP